jgi:hypothetical protein
VQRCTPFRGVHLLAIDQRGERFEQTPRICQFKQCLPRRVIQAMFGKIENESVHTTLKLLGSMWLSVK